MLQYIGDTSDLMMSELTWFDQGKNTALIDSELIATLGTVQTYFKFYFSAENKTNETRYKTADESGKIYEEVTFPLVTFDEFDKVRIEYVRSDQYTWWTCQLLKSGNTIKEREFDVLTVKCIVDTVSSLLGTSYWYVFHEEQLSKTFQTILKFTTEYLEEKKGYAKRSVSFDKTEGGNNIQAVSIPTEFSRDFDRLRIVEKRTENEIIFRFQLFKKEAFKKETCIQDEFKTNPTLDDVKKTLNTLLPSIPLKSKMIDILNRFDHLIIS
jgi:hypothetical protein